MNRFFTNLLITLVPILILTFYGILIGGIIEAVLWLVN